MQSKNRFFDDFSRMATGAMGSLAGMGREMEAGFRARMEEFVGGLDLVKRYAVDIPGRFIRMRSSFGSPNDLAAFLIAAVPVAFAAWTAEKRWNARSAFFVV